MSGCPNCKAERIGCEFFSDLVREQKGVIIHCDAVCLDCGVPLEVDILIIPKEIKIKRAYLKIMNDLEI